jgi:DNA-binding protein HU-beta
MNKNDLVSQVAEKASLNKAQAGAAVDAVFAVITSALKAGDEVRIVGFGNFVVTERAASEGRNPQTGESIKIPASKQPKFRVGKGLKDAVNA